MTILKFESNKEQMIRAAADFTDDEILGIEHKKLIAAKRAAFLERFDAEIPDMLRRRKAELEGKVCLT